MYILSPSTLSSVKLKLHLGSQLHIGATRRAPRRALARRPGGQTGRVTLAHSWAPVTDPYYYEGVPPRRDAEGAPLLAPR